MNIYSYFHEVEKECLSVPSKNVPLYQWSIYQCKLANLSKSASFDVIEQASRILQDDESEKPEFKSEILQEIQMKKHHFWWLEFSDFFLYLFVYITCIQVVYDRLVQFISGTSIDWNVNFSIGFLIQIIGIYLVLKILITCVANTKIRSSFRFWIVLAVCFILYMGINYIANLWTDSLFILPVVLWVIITFALLMISLWYIKKQNII